MRFVRHLRMLPLALAGACSAGELVLPGAPGRAAVRPSFASGEVTWAEVAGADRYYVLVSPDPAVTRQTAGTIPGSTVTEVDAPPFVVGGLPDGTTWYVRIATRIDSFVSEESPALSFTTLVRGTSAAAPIPIPVWTGTHPEVGSHFGFPVNPAGDVDGDGLGDIAIGAYETAAGGTAYVHRGSATTFVEAEPWWTQLALQTDSHFAKAFAIVGDVDGDGDPEAVVGAAEWDGPLLREGQTVMYRGDGMGSFEPTPAWVVEGEQNNNYLCRFVASLGDVNGDGIDDFAIDSHAQDAGQVDEGLVRAYYGGALPGAEPSWFDDSDQASAFLGYALSPRPGDADGDGYDDLLAGAYLWNGLSGINSGAAFLYRGGPAGLEDEPSWTFEGEESGARLGVALSFAGDVNGDGYDDAMIGADQHGPGANGRAYLVFGSASGFGAPSWFVDGAVGDQVGLGTGGAGDVNGDGYDDILVGAAGYGPTSTEGRLQLFLGGPGGPADVPSFEFVPTIPNGFATGFVNGVGDLNGDGADEFASGVLSFEGLPVADTRVYVFAGVPPRGPSIAFPDSLETDTGTAYAVPATIDAIGSPANAVCEWDFGDGTAAVVVDPCDVTAPVAYAHAWTLRGTYVLRVRVESGSGIASEAFTTVRVR